MLYRRIYQFLMIYFIGLTALMLVKYSLNLSDYTIPGVNEIWNTCHRYFGLYLMAVLNTLAVAILGHVLSICMATVVGIIGRLTLWIGSFIRVAAYNIQAYPIVAVAPSEPVAEIEHFFDSTLRMNWRLQVKIRAFENIHKLVTVIVGSATLAMVGTIVAEFIAANAGIGYSIRIALYQSDLSKILVALFLIGVCTSLYLVFLEWLGSFIKKRFGSV
jgi:NitT/TauT family transport system permease protein